MANGKASGDTMADAHADAAANYHTNDDGTTAILMADGIDSSKVRFLNGGKDPDMSKSDNGEFVGLRKEELAKYASDPYWVRLRIILLVIFALVWIAMLVAAILIIALAPRCPPRPNQEWWEKAVVYHIHPMSFQDSNGDGSGDIKGIHDRLDYLKDELKVSAVSLGPIYHSDFMDSGYDIKSHIAPCPGRYGSVDQFNDLRAALHKAGIKLILDFIPNHTSLKHPWFKQSSNETGDPKYRDFYIWSAGGGIGSPPNNLKSVRGDTSAWTWNYDRQEYYYHSISPSLPDLNLRNKDVRVQLAEALKVWLGRKVDGFTVRDAEYLVEPENIATDSMAASVTFQSESYKLVQEWRELIDNFTQEESKSRSRKTSRVLIADVNGSPELAIRFSGYLDSNNNTVPGAHLVTNKVLTKLDKSCLSECVLEHINSWTNIAGNIKSNWQVSNVDVSRLVSRYTNDEYVNAVNLLMMTLGGTVTTLYGDELAMRDGPVNITSSRFERGQLTPMLWNNSKNAGFTKPDANPWMAIPDEYHLTSLQTQQAHGSGVNHFAVFKRLIQLRSTSESLQWGKLKGVSVQNGVLLYMREAVGFDRLLIAVNFGPTGSTVDFAEYESKQLTGECHLPLEMTIVSSTFNFKGEGRVDAYKNGTQIEINKMIYLLPSEGVVLSGPPSADCSD